MLRHRTWRRAVGLTIGLIAAVLVGLVAMSVYGESRWFVVAGRYDGILGSVLVHVREVGNVLMFACGALFCLAWT